MMRIRICRNFRIARKEIWMQEKEKDGKEKRSPNGIKYKPDKPVFPGYLSLVVSQGKRIWTIVYERSSVLAPFHSKNCIWREILWATHGKEIIKFINGLPYAIALALGCDVLRLS